MGNALQTPQEIVDLNTSFYKDVRKVAETITENYKTYAIDDQSVIDSTGDIDVNQASLIDFSAKTERRVNYKLPRIQTKREKKYTETYFPSFVAIQAAHMGVQIKKLNIYYDFEPVDSNGKTEPRFTDETARGHFENFWDVLESFFPDQFFVRNVETRSSGNRIRKLLYDTRQRYFKFSKAGGGIQSVVGSYSSAGKTNVTLKRSQTIYFCVDNIPPFADEYLAVVRLEFSGNAKELIPTFFDGEHPLSRYIGGETISTSRFNAMVRIAQTLVEISMIRSFNSNHLDNTFSGKFKYNFLPKDEVAESTPNPSKTKGKRENFDTKSDTFKRLRVMVQSLGLVAPLLRDEYQKFFQKYFFGSEEYTHSPGEDIVYLDLLIAPNDIRKDDEMTPAVRYYAPLLPYIVNTLFFQNNEMSVPDNNSLELETYVDINRKKPYVAPPNAFYDLVLHMKTRRWNVTSSKQLQFRERGILGNTILRPEAVTINPNTKLEDAFLKDEKNPLANTSKFVESDKGQPDEELYIPSKQDVQDASGKWSVVGSTKYWKYSKLLTSDPSNESKDPKRLISSSLSDPEVNKLGYPINTYMTTIPLYEVYDFRSESIAFDRLGRMYELANSSYLFLRAKRALSIKSSLWTTTERSWFTQSTRQNLQQLSKGFNVDNTVGEYDLHDDTSRMSYIGRKNRDYLSELQINGVNGVEKVFTVNGTKGKPTLKIPVYSVNAGDQFNVMLAYTFNEWIKSAFESADASELNLNIEFVPALAEPFIKEEMNGTTSTSYRNHDCPISVVITSARKYEGPDEKATTHDSNLKEHNRVCRSMRMVCAPSTTTILVTIPLRCSDPTSNTSLIYNTTFMTRVKGLVKDVIWGDNPTTGPLPIVYEPPIELNLGYTSKSASNFTDDMNAVNNALQKFIDNLKKRLESLAEAVSSPFIYNQADAARLKKAVETFRNITSLQQANEIILAVDNLDSVYTKQQLEIWKNISDKAGISLKPMLTKDVVRSVTPLGLVLVPFRSLQELRDNWNLFKKSRQAFTLYESSSANYYDYDLGLSDQMKTRTVFVKDGKNIVDLMIDNTYIQFFKKNMTRLLGKPTYQHLLTQFIGKNSISSDEDDRESSGEALRDSYLDLIDYDPPNHTVLVVHYTEDKNSFYYNNISPAAVDLTNRLNRHYSFLSQHFTFEAVSSKGIRDRLVNTSFVPLTQGKLFNYLGIIFLLDQATDRSLSILNEFTVHGISSRSRALILSPTPFKSSTGNWQDLDIDITDQESYDESSRKISNFVTRSLYITQRKVFFGSKGGFSMAKKKLSFLYFSTVNKLVHQDTYEMVLVYKDCQNRDQNAKQQLIALFSFYIIARIMYMVNESAKYVFRYINYEDFNGEVDDDRAKGCRFLYFYVGDQKSLDTMSKKKIRSNNNIHLFDLSLLNTCDPTSSLFAARSCYYSPFYRLSSCTSPSMLNRIIVNLKFLVKLVDDIDTSFNQYIQNQKGLNKDCDTKLELANTKILPWDGKGSDEADLYVTFRANRQLAYQLARFFITRTTNVKPVNIEVVYHADYDDVRNSMKAKVKNLMIITSAPDIEGVSDNGTTTEAKSFVEKYFGHLSFEKFVVVNYATSIPDSHYISYLPPSIKGAKNPESVTRPTRAGGGLYLFKNTGDLRKTKYSNYTKTIEVNLNKIDILLRSMLPDISYGSRAFIKSTWPLPENSAATEWNDVPYERKIAIVYRDANVLRAVLGEDLDAFWIGLRRQLSLINDLKIENVIIADSIDQLNQNQMRVFVDVIQFDSKIKESAEASVSFFREITKTNPSALILLVKDDLATYSLLPMILDQPYCGSHSTSYLINTNQIGANAEGMVRLGDVIAQMNMMEFHAEVLLKFDKGIETLPKIDPPVDTINKHVIVDVWSVKLSDDLGRYGAKLLSWLINETVDHEKPKEPTFIFNARREANDKEDRYAQQLNHSRRVPEVYIVPKDLKDQFFELYPHLKGDASKLIMFVPRGPYWKEINVARIVKNESNIITFSNNKDDKKNHENQADVLLRFRTALFELLSE